MLGHGGWFLPFWGGCFGIGWAVLGIWWGGFGIGRYGFRYVILGCGVAQVGCVGRRVEDLSLGGCVEAWGVRFRGWIIVVCGLGWTDLGVCGVVS